MGKDNIINVALDVSGGNLPDQFKQRLNVSIDYNGVSDDTLKRWATSNRVIALQRNLRTLPTKTLNEMASNGFKVHANDCGKKIVSREQRIEDVANQYNVSEKVATVIVDDPQKFAQLMAEVETKI